MGCSRLQTFAVLHHCFHSESCDRAGEFFLFGLSFDIKYLDKDGVQKYVYTSSWGVSTRLIGALIMALPQKFGRS